jgi:hypothetical protein
MNFLGDLSEENDFEMLQHISYYVFFLASFLLIKLKIKINLILFLNEATAMG